MSTSLEQFNTKMNALASAINTKAGTSGGKTIDELKTTVEGISTGITPTGNINITNTSQTDVTNYATAQVVDANLVAGNIKNGVSILGVVGIYDNQKEEQTKTVTLNLSSGDQSVSPDDGKVLSGVTITKPATLLSSNIKKDIVIAGVTGTFEGGNQPQLNTPSLSQSGSGSSRRYYISDSYNGNFVMAYELYYGDNYVDDITTLTNEDAESLNLQTGNYKIRAKGTNFIPSEFSSIHRMEFYAITYSLTNCSKVSGVTNFCNLPIEIELLPNQNYRLPNSISITVGSLSFTLNDGIATQIYNNSAYAGNYCAKATYNKANKTITISAQNGKMFGIDNLTITCNAEADPAGYTVTIHISGTAEEFAISNATLDVDGNSYTITGSVGWWDTDYPDNDTQITASSVTLTMTQGYARWKDSNTNSWQNMQYGDASKTWTIPSNGFEIWIDIDMDE